MRERQLAIRSDKISMSGKFLFPLNVTAAGTFQVFSPAAFGDRIAKCGAIFAKWRIVKLILVAAPPTTGAGNLTAIGVVDDNTGEGGSVPLPGTISEVVELRCSKASFSIVNPNEILWKPTDPLRWYYTTAGASGSDNRLVFPATFVAISGSTGGTFNFVVYYTLEFQGAYDNVS
jgi:hypothetical protein